MAEGVDVMRQSISAKMHIQRCDANRNDTDLKSEDDTHDSTCDKRVRNEEKA